MMLQSYAEWYIYHSEIPTFNCSIEIPTIPSFYEG